MLNTTLELYNKLLNIYKTQNDKLKKAQKKMIKVQNAPENLPIDLYLDESEGDLPPMPALEGTEDKKLDPEETKIKSTKKKSNRNKIKNLNSKQIIN